MSSSRKPAHKLVLMFCGRDMLQFPHNTVKVDNTVYQFTLFNDDVNEIISSVIHLLVHGKLNNLYTLQ